MNTNSQLRRHASVVNGQATRFNFWDWLFGGADWLASFDFFGVAHSATIGPSRLVCQREHTGLGTR